MYDYGYIALHRSGHPLQERVEIGDGHTAFPGGEVYYDMIDPRRAVFEATGLTLPGTRSIMSMVAGFYAAGNRTRIVYAWDGYPRRVVMYKPVTPIQDYFPVPVYFIFGVAWARCEWDRVRNSLQRHVSPASRLGVLEATARHYLRNPTGPVELYVP